MPRRLDPTFLQLVEEAAARAYNRKRVFRSFLRRCGVPTGILAACSDQETKREWLARALPELEHSEGGQVVIRNLADALASHDAFPDLTGFEDSANRIAGAREAVEALREYQRRQFSKQQDEREAAARRAKAQQEKEARLRVANSLATLRSRLDTLAPRVGEQEAGYAFQDWFYDLADFAEIECRRPYNAGGRQIDGTLTVDGTTYLVELRLRAEQTGGPDIDGLLAKVNSKADNTMGIFVSISGFNSGAIKTSSFARTPLLLMDYTHLYHVLSSAMTLDELIRRLRRHASQTGEAFLHLSRFEAP
jgi:hypothetical protein